MSDLLRRLFTETWPAKAAKSAIEALMLPGQIAGGELATQPSAPGMWSDVDEARSQATQQGIGNRATDLAGLLMGGSYAAPAQRNAVGSGIRAYHGSPHDFDRFDLSKIGTGEGAQAYGHGLYFAENPNVAESYKHAVSGRLADHRFDGKPMLSGADWYKVVDDLNASGDWRQAKALTQYANSNEPNIELRLRQLKDWHRNDPKMVEAIARIGERVTTTVPKGRMYEVNINARPEQFLDWDKPLSGQPGEVRAALANLGIKHDPAEARAFDDALLSALTGDATKTLPRQPRDPLGSELYRKSGSVFESSSDPFRSQAFREAGIPGIKYLDQGSRSAGEGSRNYVVFDDKLIDILRKYGLAGAAGPLGALLMGGGGDAQAQPTAP